MVQSVGLGDLTVWRTGALLADEMTKLEGPKQDLAFKLGTDQQWYHQVESRYAPTIKQIKVDVVVPIKELAQVMNSLSTKANVKLLTDYEKYFKQGHVGSTSRPMLMTYLGLESIPDDELLSWSEPMRRGRAQERLIKGCQSILAKRRQSFELVDREKLRQIDEQFDKDHKRRQLALLVFKSNLSLFLLENYARLCTRLKLSELRPQRGDVGFFLI